VFNGKSILAIIPARGGSKGLPGKNTKELAGKPLIAWTIEAAKKSKYIDRVLVSADYEDIINISKRFGADVPFTRPEILATDIAKSIDVIIHALDWIKENEKKEYGYLVFLQPTSPLRNFYHIDEAVEKFFSNNNTISLVSVSKVKKNPYLMRVKNKNSFLDNYLSENTTLIRRQDMPDVFVLNGAIYIIACKDLLHYKSFNTPATAYYLMKDQYSIDIDDEYDFVIAQALIENGILK
jgi:N-acylneuraminate cytidylyltransferase/CMP-N,N'-diacetyllegionaminic acid synthase